MGLSGKPKATEHKVALKTERAPKTGMNNPRLARKWLVVFLLGGHLFLHQSGFLGEAGSLTPFDDHKLLIPPVTCVTDAIRIYPFRYKAPEGALFRAVIPNLSIRWNSLSESHTTLASPLKIVRIYELNHAFLI
jgi:hypothetical protein